MTSMARCRHARRPPRRHHFSRSAVQIDLWRSRLPDSHGWPWGALVLVRGLESRFTNRQLLCLFAVALTGVAASGCSKSDRIGVQGRVTRKDGTPLVAAKIAVRSPESGKSAIGFTDSDGRYQLGTAAVGDGLLPGEYYLTVFEDRGPVEKMRPRTINAKYEAPHLSGLQLSVQPGEPTNYDIVLDGP